MLVEARHALVLVVVPKNLPDLPMKEVYEAHQKGRWAFAIVATQCAEEFNRLYGDLPWDQTWFIDLMDDLALEKALAEVQVKAQERKPIPRPAVPAPAFRPSPNIWEPKPEEKRKRPEFVSARWARTHSNWSDQSLRTVQKKIRQMARTAF